jgi:glycosyltransferase involved in cell wall biosynthesis
MEAMASGIPVVATRINGIPELIEDGESGLLVTPGRADLLAAALRDMLGDDSRRAALAAAGRKRVAADFEVNACARELRALMGRFGVIDRNGGGQSPAMIR